MPQAHPLPTALTAPPLRRSARRRAPEAGALLLGGAWFRVRSFETRRPGEPLRAAPRTVGQTCLLLGDAPFAVGADEAVEVCLKSSAAPAPKEAARDKVVFCDPEGDTLVYQADRVNRSAALCACGNASGASAALLAMSLGLRQLQQGLVLPDGRVGLEARVNWAEGWLVEQSWVGVRFEAVTARMLGRDVSVCTGALNDYLLVDLPDQASLGTFGLEQALAFWGEARERFGFDDPLRARLAAVCCRDGPAPRVKFFTCGRAHPGAPLTGLAVLALASARVDRLSPLARAGRVEHPRGADQLPRVRHTEQGRCVDLPAIHVALKAS